MSDRAAHCYCRIRITDAHSAAQRGSEKQAQGALGQTARTGRTYKILKELPETISSEPLCSNVAVQTGSGGNVLLNPSRITLRRWLAAAPACYLLAVCPPEVLGTSLEDTAAGRHNELTLCSTFSCHFLAHWRLFWLANSLAAQLHSCLCWGPHTAVDLGSTFWSFGL